MASEGSKDVDQILQKLGKFNFPKMPESSRKFVNNENTGQNFVDVLQIIFDENTDIIPDNSPKNMLGLFSGGAIVEKTVRDNFNSIQSAKLVDVEFPDTNGLAKKGFETVKNDVFEYLLTSPTTHDTDLVIATGAGFLFNPNNPYLKSDVSSSSETAELFRRIFRENLAKLLQDKAVIIFSAEEGPPLLDGVPGFNRLQSPGGVYVYSFDRGKVISDISNQNDKRE